MSLNMKHFTANHLLQHTNMLNQQLKNLIQINPLISSSLSGTFYYLTDLLHVTKV